MAALQCVCGHAFQARRAHEILSHKRNRHSNADCGASLSTISAHSVMKKPQKEISADIFQSKRN